MQWRCETGGRVQLQCRVMESRSVIHHNPVYDYYMQVMDKVSLIFNKLAVCPMSLPGSGFITVSVFWRCYSSMALVGVWVMGTVLWKPPLFILEVQFSGTLWRSIPRGTIKRETYSGFGHISEVLSVGGAGESLVCPILGLPDELWWIQPIFVWHRST